MNVTIDAKSREGIELDYIEVPVKYLDITNVRVHTDKVKSEHFGQNATHTEYHVFYDVDCNLPWIGEFDVLSEDELDAWVLEQWKNRNM